MVKLQIKCATAGCHRRRKVSIEERQRLREEGEKTGQQTACSAPSCVKKAFENPDEHDLDIPLGELVVEAVKESPRWRMTTSPEGFKND